jgi:hypothetical protein
MLLGLGEKRFTLQSNPIADLKNPIFREQRVYAPGALVVQGPPWQEHDSAAEQLLEEKAAESFRIVFLVDDASECVQSDESFLWTIFTRFEPASDIHSKLTRVEKLHVQLSAPIVIDCRMKPWFPPVVQPLPETVSRVDAMWPMIFPNGSL